MFEAKSKNYVLVDKSRKIEGIFESSGYGLSILTGIAKKNKSNPILKKEIANNRLDKIFHPIFIEKNIHRKKIGSGILNSYYKEYQEYTLQLSEIAKKAIEKLANMAKEEEIQLCKIGFKPYVGSNYMLYSLYPENEIISFEISEKTGKITEYDSINEFSYFSRLLIEYSVTY